MKGKRKILYVDDEEINIKLFVLSLKNKFDIVTAQSAKKGLELLEEDSQINVVISDLKMPEMDGLEFIKRIKERNNSIVCMLLTGFIESEVMLEGFNQEYIYRYLIKPWNKIQLISTIEEAFKINSTNNGQ